MRRRLARVLVAAGLFASGVVPPAHAQWDGTGRTPRSAYFQLMDLLYASGQMDEVPGATLDVRVMVWGPTALGAVPFLRLTQVPGEPLKAQFFGWNLDAFVRGPRQEQRNQRCTQPGQLPHVCGGRIELTTPPDWQSILEDVRAGRQCDEAQQLSLSRTVTADAGDLWIWIVTPTSHDSYSCNAPAVGISGNGRRGLPGEAEAARVMAALWKLQTEAPLAAEMGPPREFKWLAALAGHCWIGTSPQEEIRERRCFASEFGWFIRESATRGLAIPGTPNLQWESLYRADVADGTIAHQQWDNGGGVGQDQAHYEGDALIFVQTLPTTADVEPRFRARWTKLSDTSFRIASERRDGATWTEINSMTYVLEP